MSKEKINEIKDQVANVKYKTFNDIIHDYQQIANALEEGEATEEILDELDAIEKDTEKKLLGMYYVIQQNTAKIDNFYKPQQELYKGRIQKLNRTNGILKDKCMIIADVFGDNGKYKSLELNCTTVNKEVVDVDTEVFESRCADIKDIIKGNLEDNTTDDEIEVLNVELTLSKMTIEEAKVVYAILANAKAEVTGINISLDKVKALARLKSIKPDMFNEDGAFAVKGVSSGIARYPRFS